MFKIPKRFFIFKKYPFAVLHDDEKGNEKTVAWPEAKKEMENGRIVAQPSNLGGFYFYKIISGELFYYNHFFKKWFKEDLEKMDSMYNQDVKLSEKYGNEYFLTKWLITELVF